jgi:hypothetical protein
MFADSLYKYINGSLSLKFSTKSVLYSSTVADSENMEPFWIEKVLTNTNQLNFICPFWNKRLQIRIFDNKHDVVRVQQNLLP